MKLTIEIYHYHIATRTLNTEWYDTYAIIIDDNYSSLPQGIDINAIDCMIKW